MSVHFIAKADGGTIDTCTDVIRCQQVNLVDVLTQVTNPVTVQTNQSPAGNRPLTTVLGVDHIRRPAVAAFSTSAVVGTIACPGNPTVIYPAGTANVLTPVPKTAWNGSIAVSSATAAWWRGVSYGGPMLLTRNPFWDPSTQLQKGPIIWRFRPYVLGAAPGAGASSPWLTSAELTGGQFFKLVSSTGAGSLLVQRRHRTTGALLPDVNVGSATTASGLFAGLTTYDIRFVCNGGADTPAMTFLIWERVSLISYGAMVTRLPAITEEQADCAIAGSPDPSEFSLLGYSTSLAAMLFTGSTVEGVPASPYVNIMTNAAHADADILNENI